MRTRLASNGVAGDTSGEIVTSHLAAAGVVHSPVGERPAKTPFAFILSDSTGNRQWFSYVAGARRALQQVRPAELDGAPLIYIDCYQDLIDPAVQALRIARDNGQVVFLNLGDSLPSAELAHEVASGPVEIIQVSLAEYRSDQAEDVARDVQARLSADTVIVTLGRKGAVAVRGDVSVRTAAYPIDLRHSHGAGAAFSAGYLYGFTRRHDLTVRLQFASALAALRCTAQAGWELFSVAQVEAFMLKTPNGRSSSA